eukprot:8556430-Pyramimonas_sp.AAC.1
MMGKRSPLEVLRRYTQNSVQSSPVQCRAVQCGEGRRAQSNALSLESICVQCSAVPRAHHFIDVWKPRQDRWQDSLERRAVRQASPEGSLRGGSCAVGGVSESAGGG